jgi:hypothetical protein
MTLGATLLLTACAGDGGLIGSAGTGTATTSALPPKPPVDPACPVLAAQIDEIRKDGVVERTEAAAKGKGKTVNVKRESLGKIAELEKLNAAFQAKCSTLPRAAAAPAPAKTAAATVPPAAAKAAGTAATAAKAEATKAAATKAAPVAAKVVTPPATAGAAAAAAAGAAAKQD